MAGAEIPVRLLDQLIVDDFSAQEMRIILVVIRRTYAQQRESSVLPTAVLSDLTGIGHSRVARIVTALVDRHVFCAWPDGSLSLNERYCKWIPHDAHAAGAKDGHSEGA